jgi:protein TonB
MASTVDDGLSGLGTEGWGSRMLARVSRAFGCSLTIHLGLVALVVVAGSAAMPSSKERVAWLDLEVVEPTPTPPTPAPVAASPRPRPVPRAPVVPPAVEPRKPVTPVIEEPPLAAPAPPIQQPAREVPAPEPPPAQSAPQTSIASSPSAAAEPERSAVSANAPARDAASVRASNDVGPQRETQERGVNGAGGPVVAARPPDTSTGGPIVRSARPRGGYQVRPVSPEAARRAGIQGTTVLRIFIEKDGRVTTVNVERSAGHQALDEAAAEAVRRWRFEPALNATGPVSVSALVPVEFRISDRD